MERKVSNLYLFLATVVVLSLSLSASAQGTKPGGPGANLSPEERTLAGSIASAADPAAKMKAAGKLISKFPKTTIRSLVAQDLANQVSGVKDTAQRLALAQELQKTFNQPADAEAIGPAVVQAYADANQPDEAFVKGAELLSQAPDALRLLVQLVAIGTDQVKKQNSKFLTQAIQYGDHAIQLIEGDKKPATFDDPAWKSYKDETLPGLYQSLGLLYLAKGDSAVAKTKYQKAADLAPKDAFNFMMLAGLANSEYQDEAKRYQAMPAGPARDEQLKKVQSQLDGVIDAYARAIALSEGVTALQQVRQQYLQDLESYYKYRHNGSADGMQALINKYKAPATP